MTYYDFLERKEKRANERVEELAHKVIGAAIEVHRHLGPGLSECTYRNALSHELKLQGVQSEREVAVPIFYKGLLVGEGRVDLLVEQCLVVETKVVEALSPVHRAQVLSYLHAMKLELGLLLNFNVAIMKDGIKRVISTY